MKKKLLVMMIIAIMLLMAACGAKDATPSGGGSTPSGGSESSTGESVDLQIGQVITAAHGDKCFTQVTAVVQGDTVVAAFIDEYQFADGTLTLQTDLPQVMQRDRFFFQRELKLTTTANSCQAMAEPQ